MSDIRVIVLDLSGKRAKIFKEFYVENNEELAKEVGKLEVSKGFHVIVLRADGN